MTIIPVVVVEPTLDEPLTLEMRALPIHKPTIVRCAHGGIGQRAIRRLHVGKPRGQEARGIGVVQLQQPDVARADLRVGCGTRNA